MKRLFMAGICLGLLPFTLLSGSPALGAGSLETGRYGATGAADSLAGQTGDPAFLIALERFAAEARVALVIEGDASEARPSPRKMERAAQAKTPREAMDALADANDYSVRRAPGDVVRLTKRFSRPDELPDITLKECETALRDAERLLAPYVDRVRPKQRPLSGGLAYTLSEDQAREIADPRTGLPMSRMTPEQRDAVRRVALYVFTNRFAAGLQDVRNQFTCLAGKDAKIGFWVRVDAPEKRVFGYGGKLGSYAGPYFRPLNRLKTTVNKVAGGAVAPTASEIDWDAPDPTEPGAEDSERYIRPSGTSPVVTLRQAATALPIRAFVEAPYAEKRITLVNVKISDPTALLRAMADLYGLSLKTDPDGVHRLGSPRLPPVREPGELAGALRTALPASLLRATRWAVNEERVAEGERLQASLTKARSQAARAEKVSDKESSKTFTAEADQHQASLSALIGSIRESRRDGVSTVLLRRTAVRRLRTVTEPILKQKATNKLLVSELPEEGHRALAVILALDLWEVLELRLRREPPKFISHLEDAVIIGGFGGVSAPPPGEATEKIAPLRHGAFRTSFWYRDADGKLVSAGLNMNEVVPWRSENAP